MSAATTTFSFRFGGPLADLPPALAWTLLATTALLGAALILFSYRRTLVHLAPAPRRTLTSLRLLLWLGLLLALAGPVRVERDYTEKSIRPLAILVDHSASMTTPDNRRQRRADDAQRRWRTLAPAAESAHGPPRAYAFADTPKPTPLSAADAPAAPPPGETRLFASIDQLLAQAPAGGWGGIVALTDGLDTTTPDHDLALAATARAALAAGTPLYLVPGRNRHAGGSLLALRDLALPAQVPPRSTFRLELALDTYQATDRVVSIQLRVGGVWREPETIVLDAGRRIRTYSVEIAAAEPGLLPLELRVGDAPDAPTLRAEVRVAAPASTRILYYQGALDWGYRFLADILRRDPAFTLTPIFNLAPLGARVSTRSVAAGSPPALPDTAAGYAAYDVVILANTRAEQFSPAQQDALSAWVRSGGVVLFLAPDDDTTRGFAGSELEKMLPVVFNASNTGPAYDPAVADFREQMRRSGGAQSYIEQAFAARSARDTLVPPLASFAWEPRALALLGPELATAAPRFANYARILRAKPGADVLARHPIDQAPASSERAILLALQRYGRGQSAVLASDALWRWKLNQPSTERGAELFWQNLLAWLGRESVSGARFERAPLTAELNRELILRVAGADTGLAVTVAPDPETLPSGTPLTAAPVPLFPVGEESGARLYRWTPPAGGRWVLSARSPNPDTLPTRHWLTVAARPTGEDSGLPPDEARLQALAERTGGAVLTDTPPPVWRVASGPVAPDLLRETLTPLWHHAWIFAALLALYATELLLRRRWKLL